MSTKSQPDNEGGCDLVADIGGTNARFALSRQEQGKRVLLEVQSLPGAAFDSLEAAVRHYLASVRAQPTRAAIAVACPADKDDIQFTNSAWSFNRRQLQRSLHLQQLEILNDFGAVARAVPQLAPSDVVTLHGTLSPLRGPVTVLGPGTGLGVAQLVGSSAQGWAVVETEGGHAGFAPIDEEDRRIAAWLSERVGRVSNERILCGNGLSQVHAALRGDADLTDPARIVAAALAGDPDSAKTLQRFCAILGSAAGDAVLLQGARTLVIAGGIVPRFVEFLRQSPFHARFLAKGRLAAYLADVAIHVVVHPSPGLLGAALALPDRTIDLP
ncbi:glucokinase [Tahibacter amnicola]|uniref:Glucokinase n=1 Tax=Tahibacter amnicola TaxID=2976241 RepID=A0ABY6BE81_9GAMM|nr:glucokinase [Tahibacter amnicola]UXI68115.1 glucokinase [Tahibacter amnicola]